MGPFNWAKGNLEIVQGEQGSFDSETLKMEKPTTVQRDINSFSKDVEPMAVPPIEGAGATFNKFATKARCGLVGANGKFKDNY